MQYIYIPELVFLQIFVLVNQLICLPDRSLLSLNVVYTSIILVVDDCGLLSLVLFLSDKEG